MTPLAAHLLRIMVATSPLAAHHHEPPHEVLERYTTIAEVVADVAGGTFDDQADSALMLLVVSWHEGEGWSVGAQNGTKRGDSGESWCLMQRRLGRSGFNRTPEGWTGHDLVGTSWESVHRCFVSGQNVLVRSRWTCAEHAPHGWLTSYFGECGRGMAHARRRWATFVSWRWRFPWPAPMRAGEPPEKERPVSAGCARGP